MKVVPIAEIQANLGDYIKSSSTEPIVIVEGDRLFVFLGKGDRLHFHLSRQDSN